MLSKKKWNARVMRYDDPVWQPLLELTSDHIDDFMWMGALQLDGGPEIQAYKHRWTRRYIHLAPDGRAYAYEYTGSFGSGGPSWYREVDPDEQLDRVLPTHRELAEWRNY